MLEEVQRGTSRPRPSALTGTRFLSAFQAGEEREALEAAALPVRTLRPNTDLLREGDATDQLHILVEGWGCRYKTTRDGSRQIVALVVPGDMANLDSLLFGRPDFGVRILTAAKTVAIPCDAALALAERHAGIGRAFTRLALGENAVLSQWALCLGRKSAQQRLAHLFCELGRRLTGENASDDVSFDLPLTQEQLADTLGLTSVHVNRTLQQLRGEGLVETANRTITLPDVPRLRDVAEFDPAYLHCGTVDASALSPART